MEIWLPIKEFPKYDISSDGRIRNAMTGRIIKTFPNVRGYLIATLYRDKVAHTVRVHRLVATTFYDCNYEGLVVNHIDGNKTNNHVSNLEWCTESENIIHAYRNNLRQPPRMKRVKIVETGEIFDSMSDCARAINGSVSGIYDCETGRQNTHRGYHFEWL